MRDVGELYDMLIGSLSAFFVCVCVSALFNWSGEGGKMAEMG